jgi:NADPH:quinone reductase-like Zn-dependent oxidoreductase
MASLISCYQDSDYADITASQLPDNLDPREAVTVPNNLVTVFHTLTHDLGFPLPWPKPAEYVPPNAEAPILIWGGSGSVGQYAIQVLTYWGYTNLIATASPKQHGFLKSLGAGKVVDYRANDAGTRIVEAAGVEGVKYVVDSIGSLEGSVKPIAKTVKAGAVVAIMLPVIVRDANEEEGPVYEMDVRKGVEWPEGVEVRGVRTHFYMDVSAAFTSILLLSSSSAAVS